MALVFSPRCVNVSKRNAHIKFLKIFLIEKLIWQLFHEKIKNSALLMSCLCCLASYVSVHMTVLEMWVKPLWIQYKNFWRFWLFFLSCTHFHHHDEKFFNSTSLSKKFIKTLNILRVNKAISKKLSTLSTWMFWELIYIYFFIIRLLESGKSEPTQTSGPYSR